MNWQSDATQKEYNQTLDCIADIVVYTHTVHIIAKTKWNARLLMYKLSSASINIKTSIPNVVTVIHTANPNCVYYVQSISLAHVQSSGRGEGGGFQNKKWTHTHTYQFQNTFALLLPLIVHKPYMLMTANTLPFKFHLIGAHTHVPT